MISLPGELLIDTQGLQHRNLIEATEIYGFVGQSAVELYRRGLRMLFQPFRNVAEPKEMPFRFTGVGRANSCRINIINQRVPYKATEVSDDCIWIAESKVPEEFCPNHYYNDGHPLAGSLNRFYGMIEHIHQCRRYESSTHCIPHM